MQLLVPFKLTDFIDFKGHKLETSKKEASICKYHHPSALRCLAGNEKSAQRNYRIFRSLQTWKLFSFFVRRKSVHLLLQTNFNLSTVPLLCAANLRSMGR